METWAKAAVGTAEADARRRVGLEVVSDEGLEMGLRAALGREREAAAEVVAHLIEVDRRRLYAERGYATLWEYAVAELSLSEDQAARRVKAVESVKAAPAALALLRSGALTMSVLAELSFVLRAGREFGVVDGDEVLDFARGRSVREVRRWVAEELGDEGPRDSTRHRLPKEVVESGRRRGTYPRAGGTYEVRFTAGEDFVRKLERARELLGHVVVDGDYEEVLGRGLDLLLEAEERRICGKNVGRRRTQAAEQGKLATPPAQAAPSAEPATSRRVAEDPGSAAATSRPAPSSEPATSRRPVEAAAPAPATSRSATVPEPVTSRRMHASETATSPRAVEDSEAATSRRDVGREGRRAVPRAVRREVWERDGGRCGYVSASTGRICGARTGIEIDHVVPWAVGGADTAANLRLRCRTHNRSRAERELSGARFRRSGKGSGPGLGRWPTDAD